MRQSTGNVSDGPVTINTGEDVMRRLILASLVAAAVAVPVAFAAPGGTPGKPDKPTPAKAAPKVAFVVKGVVTFTVTTDASTKFSKAGVTGATIANVVVTDRVVVRHSAKKKSTAGGLGALFTKKVTDQGPKPAA